MLSSPYKKLRDSLSNSLSKKPALTYSLIGLLTALLLYIVWQDEEGGSPTDSAELRGPREPDGFIVNGVYRAYGSDGALSSRIETVRGEQFEGDQYAQLAQPRGAVFEKETGLPWLISASDGRYDLESEQLLLVGAVEIVRDNPGLAPSRLLSERLTLDNRQRIVHTEAPVTLLDFRGTTDAVGMRAWVDQRVIEFESQVEGHYVIENLKKTP